MESFFCLGIDIIAAERCFFGPSQRRRACANSRYRWQHCATEQRQKTLDALPRRRASAAINHAGSVRVKLEHRAAAEHDTNQQALMTEALNLLFRMYGKLPTA
jgi:hypothetical protein